MAAFDEAIEQVKTTDSSRKASSDKEAFGLAQALSIALCMCNKHVVMQPKIQCRVCIVQLAKDQSHSYNAVMNSIFTAHKMGLLVDSLNLGRCHSSFLQQAAYLTGGNYLFDSSDQRDSLQKLLTHCVASGHTRQILKMPTQKSIDFKASCFCHGKSVDFAYMCSVCLALTCGGEEQRQESEPTKKCRICETPLRPTAR